MIVGITCKQGSAVGCDASEAIGFQIADCPGQDGDSLQSGVAGHLDWVMMLLRRRYLIGHVKTPSDE